MERINTGVQYRYMLLKVRQKVGVILSWIKRLPRWLRVFAVIVIVVGLGVGLDRYRAYNQDKTSKARPLVRSPLANTIGLVFRKMASKRRGLRTVMVKVALL